MKALRLLFSVSAMLVLTSGMAFAQDAEAVAANVTWVAPMIAGIAICIAAFGCALAMGRAASAAFEGVSRNPSVGPRIMTMMILALALIESLAIYSLVIAILLLFR